MNNHLQNAEKLAAARTELDKRSGSNGMAPGAAAVMAARDRGELKGIIGTISKVLSQKRCSHCRCSCHRSRRRNELCSRENDQVAAEAMALLKSRNLGRATFLPLNKMQANRATGKSRNVG